MRVRSILISMCVLVALTTVVGADAIPYPTPGIQNPVTYTFTAMNTGDVIAYAAGPFPTGAAFTNEIGMLVNGVSTGIFGLNNQTTPVGTPLDLGHVNAGDTIVFDMHNLIPGLGDVYSNPSLNGPYDFGTPGPGVNHVYSTPYTATSPILPGVPPGIYVAFEDLPATNPPDYNYQDETFVFTNVAETTSAAPLPGVVPSGLVLLGGLIVGKKLRSKRGSGNI